MHMPKRYLLHDLGKSSLTIITIISINEIRLSISSVNFICPLGLTLASNLARPFTHILYER